MSERNLKKTVLFVSETQIRNEYMEQETRSRYDLFLFIKNFNSFEHQSV